MVYSKIQRHTHKEYVTELARPDNVILAAGTSHFINSRIRLFDKRVNMIAASIRLFDKA